MKIKMNKAMYIVSIYLIASLMFSCSKQPEEIKLGEPDEDISVAEGHYRNPLSVERELELIGEGGIADPSVFRWMGKYYLMTTQFVNYKANGFKIWESTNLVEWKYKTAIHPQDFQWDILWSPEMYFYRGTFYIYISGPGGKMAAMKYETQNDQLNPNPFGQNAVWEMISHDFLKLNDHSIDGSILIEANGDKFAFFSGLNGVKYRKINSMEDGDGGAVIQLTKCSVNNIDIKESEVGTKAWTEAPTAFKKNGVYYLTYTGNHFLRPDYQIHLALGTSLNNLNPISNNPWVTRIYGDWTATGNCYPILGPNLRDYYYTYHVKEGYRISSENEQLLRKLMLDKVEFKANSIDTKAPTFEDEPIPTQADYIEDFSTGLSNFTQEGSATWTAWNSFAVRVVATENWNHRIYSKTSTENNFVAEATMRMIDFPETGNAKVAFIHGENGQEPNLVVGLATENNIHKLVVYDKKNQWQNINLPEFDVKDWTDIRIEKNGAELKIFVNNIEIVSKAINAFEASKVGYLAENCTADISWLAFSNF